MIQHRLIIALIVYTQSLYAAQPPTEKIAPTTLHAFPNLPPELQTKVLENALTLQEAQPASVMANYKAYIDLKRTNKFAYDYLSEITKSKHKLYPQYKFTRYQNWLLSRLTAADFKDLNMQLLKQVAFYSELSSTSQKPESINDLTILAELLINLKKLDPHIRMRTQEGKSYSLLVAAAKARIDPMVNLLLKAKLFNPTANLLSACTSNLPELVQKLLQQGANVHIKDTSGYSPLLAAVALVLKDANASLIANILLDHGADPNEILENETSSLNGLSALMIACKLDKLVTVNTLIQHGALINQQNPFNKTALSYALNGANFDLVYELISHGANIQQAVTHDPHRYPNPSPLFAIVQWGIGWESLSQQQQNIYTEIVAYIIGHGVDINEVDNQGDTPLHRTAARSEFITQVLLQFHPNVNARNAEGETPLMIATHVNDADIIKILLKHGADPLIADNRDITPIAAAEHYARSSGLEAMKEHLKKESGKEGKEEAHE